MVIVPRAVLAAAVAAVLAAGCSSTTPGAAGAGRTASATAAGPPPAASQPAGTSGPSTAGSDPTSGPNPAFTCSSAFVTTLTGFPVARKVRHYPVPKLTPTPHGLAGRAGLAAFKRGELDLVYTRESTGLPQGPSRSMYSCFVRQVRARGWAPDTEQNKAFRKHRTKDAPLLYSFYDSGSRYKSGNELTVRWFDSKGNYGLGALLSVIIEPNQHIPDLPPPPG